GVVLRVRLVRLVLVVVAAGLGRLVLVVVDVGPVNAFLVVVVATGLVLPSLAVVLVLLVIPADALLFTVLPGGGPDTPAGVSSPILAPLDGGLHMLPPGRWIGAAGGRGRHDGAPADRQDRGDEAGQALACQEAKPFVCHRRSPSSGSIGFIVKRNARPQPST